MGRQGWISVHRKILDNPVFQNPYLFKLWMYCLLKASHKEHKQLVGKEVVTLKEGQFIWGRNESTNELNHGAKPSERKSSSTWERLLKLLEELEMLNRITNNKYTVINIVNWRVYQGYNKNIEQGNEPIMNRKRTDSEPKVNTNNNVNNANNDLEEEERAREENPFVLFEENICRLSPLNIDGLNQWCDDLGDELVIAAIKLAAKYNARSFAYVEDIFIEWHKNGIKTVEDARNYVREKNRRNNTIPFKRKQETNDVQTILDKFREV